MERTFRDIIFTASALIKKHPRANLTPDSLTVLLYLYYLKGAGHDSDQLYIDAYDWIMTMYYDSDLINQVFDKLNSYNLDTNSKKDLILWSLRNHSVFVRDEDYYDSTSDSLAELAARLLEFKEHEVVFDAGSGRGEAIEKFYQYSKAQKIDISLAGTEANYGRYLVSKIHLSLLDIPANIQNGDLLYEKAKIPSYDKAYCFPPFGGRINTLSAENNTDQYAKLFNGKSDAEWLFVFKMLEHMKENGKLVLSAYPGLLYRFSGRAIHTYLINNNLIEGIITLPRRTYRKTGIPATIIVLSEGNKRIKYVDATDMVVEIDDRSYSAIDVDSVVNEYFGSDVRTIDYDLIINNGYRLDPETYFKTKKPDIAYSTPISMVATIDKGSQYTVARFKDVISKKETDYQILTSGDIQANGTVDFSKLTYINGDKKLLKFVLKENDIVVTTKSTRVKTFVARNLPKTNIIVTGGMLVIHPNTEMIDPTFLKIFLDSETGAEVMSSIMRGLTIKTISYVDFKKLNISCPPMDQQKEYAKKYNNLVAMYNAIKAQLDEMQEEIDSFYENQFRGA